MTDYPFDMQLVVDPLKPENVVSGGAVTFFDPSDTAGVSPIAVKDPSGLPLPNPMTSNAYGFISPFIATIPKVKWKSGDFDGFFYSYDGLRNEAIAAKEAAQAAAALVGAPADDAMAAAINGAGTATRGALNATILSKAVTAGYADPSQSVAELLTPILTKIARAKPNSRPTIRIVMVGPSIVVGGDVDDYATQGPLPLLVAALKSALDPLATCDWVSVNLGINGSVANQWLAPLQAEIAANGAPDLVGHAGGMNDFTGVQWHKSQTYDVIPGTFGFLTECHKMFDYLNGLNVPVIAATSPVAHPGRIPNNGGLSTTDQASGIIYPGSNVYQWPGYPGPEKPNVTLPSGATVQTLSRFKQGNDGIRAVSAEKGVICLDAELLFLEAVAQVGYDALYNTGQYNHPNTLGIDVSYGAAFRALGRALKNTRIQATKTPAGVGGDAYPVGYKAHKIRPDNAAAITSTTPVADNQLFYSFPTIAAATTWRVKGVIHFTVPVAQDGRLSWTTTGLTLANGRWAVHAPGSGAALAAVTGAAPSVNSGDGTFRSAPMSSAVLIGGNGADGAAFIDAIVDVPAGGGQLLTLNEYLDQTGGTMTVYAKSRLTFERLS